MLSPNLMVQDIEKTLEFYTKTLGFEEEFKMPGPDGKTVYAAVKWKDVSFMFGSASQWLPADALPYRGTGVDFYIIGEAEDDIDQYYTRLKEAGVNMVQDIQDQFWGDRTFTIKDLDGYQLTFAKNVRQVTPEEMMEAMKNMG
jgi:PhnB protein